MVVAAADFCFFLEEGFSMDEDSGTGISAWEDAVRSASDSSE